MKTAVLLLLCLLLCGCDAGDSGITNVSSLTPPDLSGTGLHTPGSRTEEAAEGQVTVFPLQADVYDIRAWGNGILVFSGTDQTRLTLLTGSSLSPAASVTLPELLPAEDPSLQLTDSRFSCFLKASRETLVLDETLQEIGRIPSPEDQLGPPLLSASGDILYYCTEQAILAWELESGRHRLLKEIASPGQQLTGLCLEDSVLLCTVTDREQVSTLFLSTENGALLGSCAGSAAMISLGSRYYALLPGEEAMIFGSLDEETPSALFPKDSSAQGSFLPLCHGAVTVSQPEIGPVTVTRYCLSSGTETGTLTLSENLSLRAIAECEDGSVYLLCLDPLYQSAYLYRWQEAETAPPDGARYTGTYYSASAPDTAGLERCRSYAESLSAKHGIRILTWKYATALEPWDYDLEPEHRVPILMAELEALDRNLSEYPRTLLEQTAGHFSSLSICLVRSIVGTPESGSVDSATGIQYTLGPDAYVVLATGEHSRRSLYHELFHAMETHLLGNTPAFDRWDELNPTGFRYDYSYEANRARKAGVYLQHNSRAFVDTYSMSYPKEDRARIMEYAMLPGNRELFAPAAMQRKLKALCEGIRDAFGLKEDPRVFLWEQYLEE